MSDILDSTLDSLQIYGDWLEDRDQDIATWRIGIDGLESEAEDE